MSNAEQRGSQDAHKKQSDEGIERVHVERQPVPGHPENIPVDGDMKQGNDGTPVAGPVDGDAVPAPDAEPATKPGTPPGTQSERDRLRGDS